MELFVQIFIAVATGCSAVFMYVELLKKRPFARADVLDLSGSEIKGSDAERLQAEGYYQLVVEIHGGQSNCRNKRRTLGRTSNVFFRGSN